MKAPEQGHDAVSRMLSQLTTFQKFVLMGQLLSGITHEVNNHLTGVYGYAQLLLSQEHTKTVAKEADKICASAIKCRNLIADLKRFAQFTEEKEFNNINLILKSSLDLVRRQFLKKSFRLSENYAEDIPPFEVDATALEQMFLNVIQNSFAALQEKGGGLSISTRREDGRVVAILEDDGPGMSEEALAHLFTPFFTTKAHLRCLGLGLTASKMLAEAHGATLEVNNRPSGGTSVKVSFPCQSHE